MIVYDIETYPNCFTLAAVSHDRDDMHVFELSDRRNDWQLLEQWFHALAGHGVEMVGFNNLGFDYPVIHALIHGTVTRDAAGAYAMAQAIFDSKDRFQFNVWPNERFIPQVDLYKIHHFDNPARSTSLKALQFAMRSPSVEDLPIAPGTVLTSPQIDELIKYNIHDVEETKRFLAHSEALIDFRRSLDLSGDKMNFSDKKIGSQMLVDSLGRKLCYSDGGPRQTQRASIHLGSLIFPTIQFDAPDLVRVKNWLASQVITETKGVFTDLSATVAGLDLHFGTGGIHGSVKRKVFHEDDDRMIVDIDVTSLYPSVAIANNLAPEHLGERFVSVYAGMKAQRLQHAKGTPQNAALKLALNGAYGDSNSAWSPFFDPNFTMTITINGQLLLARLFEMVCQVPSVEPIQINTDGITVRIKRDEYDAFKAICANWERETGLDLESAFYRSMWVRDVNNYVALTTDGKVKAKGAYEIEKAWHKDPSSACVAKAAEAVFLHGVDVDTALMMQTDPFDWMVRAKASGGARVYHGEEETGAKVVRFFASIDGEPMSIRRPPPAGKKIGDFKKAAGVDDKTYAQHNVTGVWNEHIHTKNRSTYDFATSAVCKGHLTTRCDVATDFNWSTLDRSYYRKLVADLVDLVVVE